MQTRRKRGEAREQVFEFVRRRLLEGESPTVREVQQALGFSAVQSAQQHLEALAGVKQPLVAYIVAHQDTRLLPGRFMAIEQAVGTPQGRPAGLAFLRSFVEQMKSSGFVAQALTASGQDKAMVAPSQ